ncbi:MULTISPECIES: LysR family transcriptional regulator [Roseovarius]|uniref:LysR family transcriptional regulator n=1 Tax=Roseovarius TaxID=74030 RepID=UPI003009543D|tara:strand:+ start:3872 stop:4780 length:909 start_codon:yes stop_codon:yes gene_type:complete
MKGVTLQRLQVFCAVYKAGSISQAARDMFLSQPTVSRHLHDFEAVMNLTLFLRDKGRLVPTEAADALYDSSRFLDEGISRLESRVASIRQGSGMRLAVMGVTLMMPYFIPQAILRLLRDMPALDFSVNTGILSQQLSVLRNGQVDIGLAAGGVFTSDIQSEKLGEGRLMALIPESWDLAEKAEIDLADLCDRPTVNLTARGPIGRVLSDALAERGLSFDRQIMGHSLFTAPYLAASLGRAVVVDEYTAFNHPVPSLRLRPLSHELTFDISAIFHAQSERSIAAESFVGHLRALLRDWDGAPA